MFLEQVKTIIVKYFWKNVNMLSRKKRYIYISEYINDDLISYDDSDLENSDEENSDEENLNEEN